MTTQYAPRITRNLRRAACAAALVAISLVAQAGAKEDIQADMQAGRWTQAGERLDAVLAKHPDNALAHYWLAQVKAHEGDRAAAREQLTQARRLDPAQRFAGDPKALARLEQAIAEPTANPHWPAPKTDAAPEVPAPRARTQAQEPSVVAPPARPARSWFSLMPWVLVAAVLIGGALLLRRLTRGREQAQTQDLRGTLRGLASRLREADRALDTRVELTPEQRLGLHDKGVLLQSELTRYADAQNLRPDDPALADLVRRARDGIADLRGEERPSEIEERRRMEAAQYASQQPVIVQQPMPGSAPGAGLGGVLAGAAAGAVLGSMIGGHSDAHARTRPADNDYVPFDDPARGNDLGIDVGGNGDAGWDSGGDVGGSGDNFD